MIVVKTPLLPEEPFFQFRPTRLMEAVSELPEAKGPLPQRQKKLQDLFDFVIALISQSLL